MTKKIICITMQLSRNKEIEKISNSSLLPSLQKTQTPIKNVLASLIFRSAIGNLESEIKGEVMKNKKQASYGTIPDSNIHHKQFIKKESIEKCQLN